MGSHYTENNYLGQTCLNIRHFLITTPDRSLLIIIRLRTGTWWYQTIVSALQRIKLVVHARTLRKSSIYQFIHTNPSSYRINKLSLPPVHTYYNHNSVDYWKILVDSVCKNYQLGSIMIRSKLFYTFYVDLRLTRTLDKLYNILCIRSHNGSHCISSTRNDYPYEMVCT